MRFRELKYLIYTDLYRYEANTSIKKFFYYLLLEPPFKLSFTCRCTRYFVFSHKRILGAIFRLLLRHYNNKFSCMFSYQTDFGPGLHLGHGFGIGLCAQTKTGKNFTASMFNTVSHGSVGEERDWPMIGDNVYMATGSRAFGPITIGNNVAVGANAVVTKDVDDNFVVAGVPARKISDAGSFRTIQNTDYVTYEEFLVGAHKKPKR